MFLDQLNMNQLRVFEAVYRTASMTTAAHELHLTQSGVSQHIKTLEDALGIKLFDRIKQKLIPTSQSTALYKECSEVLFRIEQALLRVKDGGKNLMGSVSIGMPIEFGNHRIMPLLSEFGQKHKHVSFKLQLGFASQMNDLLLKGELDFAFVDEFTMDPRITTEKVSDETLELCIAENRLKNTAPERQDRKFFESLDYVEYQEDEPILRMWFAHHLKQKNMHLNIRSTVMDVQGLAILIITGMGAGTLPGYLLDRLQEEGNKLYRFKGCGRPLKNTISVAYLRDRTQSLAGASVLEFLKKSLLP
jgi:DNA-binding transcriptional LysR family regulator